MKYLQRALIVAVVVGLLSAFAGTAAAQEYPAETLTVDGFGQAFGAPDVAIVQLGVQNSSTDVLEAYNSTNEAVESLIAALVEAGIAEADIQTTGLYMYQDTPYNPTTGEPSNEPIYRVQNSLNVTVRDVEQVGAVINAGVAAGANNIGGITFSIADPAELAQEARSAAIDDARQRAEQLADLMGVTLGNPTIIVEANNQGVPLFYDRVQSAMGGAGAPVQEGQLSVAVQVRVTFNIEQASS